MVETGREKRDKQAGQNLLGNLAMLLNNNRKWPFVPLLPFVPPICPGTKAGQMAGQNLRAMWRKCLNTNRKKAVCPGTKTARQNSTCPLCPAPPLS